MHTTLLPVHHSFVCGYFFACWINMRNLAAASAL